MDYILTHQTADGWLGPANEVRVLLDDCQFMDRVGLNFLSFLTGACM